MLVLRTFISEILYRIVYSHDEALGTIGILHMYRMIAQFKRIYVVRIGQCPRYVNGCG